LAETKKKEKTDDDNLNASQQNQSSPMVKSSSGSLLSPQLAAMSPVSTQSSGIDGDEDVPLLLDESNQTLSPLPRKSRSSQARSPKTPSSPATSTPRQFSHDPSVSSPIPIAAPTTSASSGSLAKCNENEDSLSNQDLNQISQSCPQSQTRISPVKVTLSAAMAEAISAPRVEEEEALGAMLAAARLDGTSEEEEDVSRTVSDKEWQLLQQEVQAAREKLGQPCQLCLNYEAQLVAAQSIATTASASKELAEKCQSEAEDKAEKEKTLRLEMEERLTSMAEEIHLNTKAVKEQLKNQEESIKLREEELLKASELTKSQIMRLTAEREEVCKELNRLQLENDDLVGKHSKAADELQNESINLPTSMDDMQLLLLKFREDIITAKVAQAHMEENLRSELLFLKDQAHSEQQERDQMEEALNKDITSLMDDKAALEEKLIKLGNDKKTSEVTNQKQGDVEAQLKSLQTKSKQIIHNLKMQVEEGLSSRTSLEEEVKNQKTKVAGLQVELDNSEAVQRDFVQLSQNLQIQLERIRASETEVRWQHEEDVDGCTNCLVNFAEAGNPKAKHHCRHCGKIFCSSCTTKTVVSGRSSRPSRVCDVCHTILVPSATPFFSQDPAQDLNQT